MNSSSSSSNEAWSLTEEQRLDSLTRAFSSLCSLGFTSSEAEEGKDQGWKVANALEGKAYAAAEAQAVTTTGPRPKVEVTKAYARKLGELICEAASGSNSTLGANEAANMSSSSKVTELDISGTREFLTKSAAKGMLSALFTENSKVEKVVFSMKSFAIDAAEVAALGLINVKNTLKDVDISDTIAGRPESEALQVLRVLSGALSHAKLHSLNLSDNALGEKGIRACSPAIIGQTALQRLSLRNVGCSDKACKAVDELLDAPGLQGLYLYNNMSGDAGAQFISSILSRAPTLQQFQMGSSRIGAEGAMTLSKGLCAGTTLMELDLSDNPLTEDAAEGLSNVIKHHACLKVLNLNDTCLGDAGASVVASSLAKSAPNLEVLELALNEITSESAKQIAVALVNKTNLKKLNLRENELEDRGTQLVAHGLQQNRTLQELDMVMNMIGRDGAVSIVKILPSKPNFRRLELDENQISEEGIEEIQEILLSAFGNNQILGSMEENEPGEEY